MFLGREYSTSVPQKRQPRHTNAKQPALKKKKAGRGKSQLISLLRYEHPIQDIRAGMAASELGCQTPARVSLPNN